ncbi:MAG: hypothetical protein PHF64_00795 [Methanoregula sp.]|nr:hypothetical protein [Methanoregula sp.]
MPANSDSVTSIDNEGTFSHSHDVTLQRLDTSLPFAGTVSGKLKYTIDNFTGTEQAWDRTLAVFVPPGVPVQHVDHAAFARDPQGEARRLGFRIVGHHAETKVIGNGPGEPRAITKAVFSDPEVDELASSGKLSLSTGFDANILKEGVMAGKVQPNHVLYFLRNEKTAYNTLATANDTGAMVNNISEETMAEDVETKGILTKILDAVSAKPAPAMEPVKNVEDPRIATLTAQINELTKENISLKESKTALDNLMAERAKIAKDAEWQEVKNLHQPGLFHKEKEAVERTAYEAAPARWLMSHVGNLQTLKSAPAKGTEAVGNLGDDDTQPFDVVAARGKLNPLTGRFE